LDRDGTLNEGFNINHPEEFRLFHGIPEALKKIQDVGYKLIVVTNQAGVGLAYMSEEELDLIHQRMADLLAVHDVTLVQVYSSFYHAKAKQACHRENAHLRKPEPGMITLAAAEHGIDLSCSWMIGDRASDIEAGIAAGTKTILVTTGHGQITKRELAGRRIFPDLTLPDLAQVATQLSERGL
jgi:D-glycero-D-manno-heptose 1,7-bisphosphate phosphatase